MRTKILSLHFLNKGTKMRNMDKLSCSYDGRFAPKQCKPGKLNRYLNWRSAELMLFSYFKLMVHHMKRVSTLLTLNLNLIMLHNILFWKRCAIVLHPTHVRTLSTKWTEIAVKTLIWSVCVVEKSITRPFRRRATLDSNATVQAILSHSRALMTERKRFVWTTMGPELVLSSTMDVFMSSSRLMTRDYHQKRYANKWVYYWLIRW